MTMIDVGDSVELVFPLDFSPASASVTVTAPDGSTRVGSWSSGGGPSGPITISVDAAGASAPVTLAQAGTHTVAWQAAGPAGQAALRDIITATDPDTIAGISLDELRQHLGVAVRVRDDQLRGLALVATEAAEQYTGRLYRRQAVTETHTGDRRVLVLRRAPAVSVTSVEIDGTPLTGTIRLTPGGLLYHPSGAWPCSTPYGITVTYQAGAEPAARARHGILELARHLWETQRGGSNLPRQAGADSEWDPRQAFSVPRRVAELLDGDADCGIA